MSAKFSSMAAPSLANPGAMATTTVGSTLDILLSDGKTQSYKLAYQPFFITGDLVADGKGGKVLAGGYYDINNQPIMDNTVAGKERHYFSDSPDGTSLLKIEGAKVNGVKGNTVFAVVQFEYATYAQDGKTKMYGKLPSPIAVLTLDQDPDSGRLSLVKYHNVDTSGVNGLWITCGASLSPWGTHLSSEEYEPDAFADRASNFMNDFSQNLYGDAGHRQPLPLRPHAGSDRQRRRQRQHQEALLHGPHLARAGAGDAGQPHRASWATTPPTPAISYSSPTRKRICRPVRCTWPRSAPASRSTRPPPPHR